MLLVKQKSVTWNLFFKKSYNSALKSDTILRRALNKEKYTGKDLDAFIPTEADAKKLKHYCYPCLKGMMRWNQITRNFGRIWRYLNGEVKKAEAADTPPKDYRVK
jgi:hypothetical protein